MLRIRSVKFAVAVAVILGLANAATPSQAADGRVRIHVAKAGFIVGIGGGSGTLFFHGHAYPLSIGGLGLGTFGISHADLVGTAHHLHRAEDIAGSYAAAGAGVAVIGGRQVARLQNANGVVLELRGPQVGLEVSLNLSGMTIAVR